MRIDLPLVSIILKTWNGLAWTRLCLESLKKYTHFPYELIIVDNGSTDGTAEFLQELGHAKLIFNENNKGCIYANIQGVEQANGQYVCLIDNDIVVSANWLDNLVEAIQSDPENQVGIVAPLQISRELSHPYSPGLSSRDVWDQIIFSNKSQSPQEALEAFCSPYSYDQFVQDFIYTHRFTSAFVECPPEFVGGSCMLISRNALEQIRGFSNLNLGNNLLYGGDDVEICWRLGDAGYKVFRTSKTYVHHFKHSSVNVNLFDRKFHNSQSCEILFGQWKDVLEKIIVLKLSQGNGISSIQNSSLMLGLYSG